VGWGERGQELEGELERMREQNQVAKQVMALKGESEGGGENTHPHMLQALSEKVRKTTNSESLIPYKTRILDPDSCALVPQP
jgi:hypothetical protein